MFFLGLIFAYVVVGFYYLSLTVNGDFIIFSGLLGIITFAIGVIDIVDKYTK